MAVVHGVHQGREVLLLPLVWPRECQPFCFRGDVQPVHSCTDCAHPRARNFSPRKNGVSVGALVSTPSLCCWLRGSPDNVEAGDADPRETGSALRKVLTSGNVDAAQAKGYLIQAVASLNGHTVREFRPCGGGGFCQL